MIKLINKACRIGYYLKHMEDFRPDTFHSFKFVYIVNNTEKKLIVPIL